TELSRYNGNINHGDMVAGSSGGAGNLNPLMKGIATGAHFFITEYDQSFTDTTIGLHKYKHVMVTNTSYSDGCNRYTNVSQTIDVQHLQNKKLIHVFSAGNNNGANCGYGAGNQWGNVTGGHKQGKNCIDVANIDDNIEINTSSSRGPAHDGRLKPDVSAHGTNVNMTLPNNTYTVNSGTSFSAPITAGVLAVMYQTYRMENNGNDPDGALMKAVLLNTATEIGNYGPDYKFGWGVANTQRAVEAIQNQQFSLGAIDQSEVKTIKLKMPDNIKLAKVMLLWNDYQATPNVKKALVNDLDLKIIGPDQKTILPFVLDPTPNIISLDAPAKKGRDSLNNVEQVAIENPIPGAEYTIEVSGYNIPKGIQEYYLTYDFFEESIKPIELKKESFLPAERIAARWITTGVDTGIVNIAFTANNGQSWTNVGNRNVNLTHTFFNLPRINTDRAKFRFTFKNKQFETAWFSICEQPKTLNVTKVCPDSVSLSWDAVAAPVSYELMYLGKKHMESIGKTRSTSIKLATPSDFFKNADNWFSIRTQFDSTGMLSKRKNAISVPASLLNCPLGKDLSLEKNFLSTEDNYSSQCIETVTDSVEINIINEGEAINSGAFVSYQFGDNSIVTDSIFLQLGKKENFTHKFATKLSITGIGKTSLKAWVSLQGGDLFLFNDTIVKSINHNLVNSNNAVRPFSYAESFNNLKNTYPEGWAVKQVPADNYTWEKTVVPGIDGQRSGTMSINLNQALLNRSDELLTTPILIDSTVEKPFLLFDIAYGAGTSPVATDILEVFVYENCGKTGGKRLISLSEKTLSTDNESNVFQPNSATSWKTVPIDISAYKGKTVSFGFKATSKRITVLYLDNVRFQQFVPKAAVADIIAANSLVCPNGLNTYSAKNIDPSFSYEWTFAGGSPARAVGPGPIDVFYANPGVNTTVTLKQASLIGSSTTQFTSLQIQQLPTAKFSVVLNGLSVECKNQSQFAKNYTWEFGDGKISNLAEPINLYDKEGSYTIVLNAENECGAAKLTRKVNLTNTATTELGTDNLYEILPNPNDGNFEIVVNNSETSDAQITITDISGKICWSKKVNFIGVAQKIRIEQPQFAPGIYLVNIQTKDNLSTLKFVKK
ncbi:MAG: S8 family serine peptidase, partial [Saprospiraceae bacterium]